MTEVMWVLGAPDPEMEAIKRLLRAAGQRVTQAMDASGRRVTAGTAYAMAPLPEPLPWGGKVIMVECDCAVMARRSMARAPWIDAPMPYRLIQRYSNDDDNEYLRAYRVDHHRPGDPGYGKPPAEFLAASSIGQVLSHLAILGALPGDWPSDDAGPMCESSSGQSDMTGLIDHLTWGEWRVVDISGARTIPSEIVMTAAADHCLAHAYAGRCPGVDPDALMQWRAESRAAFQGRPVAEVLADIERATTALRAARTVRIAGIDVAVMGRAHVPELPEAASRIGMPFLAVGRPDRDGRTKQVLQSAPPAVIAEWMAAHPGSYGDPARGFAGRYIS